DSAGAAFINDSGVWKLAGINYAVDGPFYVDNQGNGAFNAALFDTSGFYGYDGAHFVPSSGPSALYPTRISSRLPWIALTIAESSLTHIGNSVAFTYTRLIVPAADLQYTVEQSTDLVNWSAVTPNEQIITTNGSVETVQDTIPTDGTPALFLRLRITR
ncbi:MAG TPA: hypothetical protein VGC85_11315, partial [Chthoniobacterales bacterium]